MPKFSQQSVEKLSTCDERLQRLFLAVVQEFDCTVLEGYRNKARQNEMYRTGKSQIQYPNGKHNSSPSKAIDVAPYPIDWNDREFFTYFAGYVKGLAKSMGINIRWGGNWANDNNLENNIFDDLVHFEIV